MREVLISIQPKWCELIASGKKTVEVRKTRPNIKTPFKCYIYQTKKPVSVSFSGTGKHISEYDKTCYYNERSGKVIGEIVCDRVQPYESEFVDDDCYENIASLAYDEDGDVTGFIEWSNDDDIPYESTHFYKKCCVKYEELKKYIGIGINQFYAWHISDLVIYDKPKELSEFQIYENIRCSAYLNRMCLLRKQNNVIQCKNLDCQHKRITRPPQSWCYVELLKGGAE